MLSNHTTVRKFFYISMFYVQFSRKLYTPKDYEENVHQEGTVISEEKDSELKCGLSANLHRSSLLNRYVGGMISITVYSDLSSIAGVGRK
jgi:hypothetical protein